MRFLNPPLRQVNAAKALAVVGLFALGLSNPLRVLAAPLASNALPTGGAVQAGSAMIAANGNTMNINQSSQRAVIAWDSFNVGKNSTVNFNQPNSNAATLNIVNGSSKSMIDGAVNANGQVIFVNQNGVVFGKNAEVNVGGMVATTMSVDANEFMNGNSSLTYIGNGSGKIVNKGNITGNNVNSYIALMAPEVKNEGVISAMMSGANAVALVAGKQVTLTFNDHQLVNVYVDASAIKTLIQNKRLIQVNGGQILIAANSAQDLKNSVVQNSGTLAASGISTKGGVITLVADTVNQSGNIAANSDAANAGQVVISGNNVTLASGSKTTAAGAANGGQILVGKTNINAAQSQVNAKVVNVEQGALVDASSTQNGNGGTIAVWSQIASNVAGIFKANGGTISGNGGTVDTSSAGKVTYGKGLTVDTTAPNGKTGNWITDPLAIIIDSVAAGILSNALLATNVTLDATLGSCGGTGACSSAASPLISFLAGTNVYSSNPNTSLTLNAAGGTINFDGTVTVGQVYAVAQNINVNGSIGSTGGSNGNIYLAGASLNILGSIGSNGSTQSNTNIGGSNATTRRSNGVNGALASDTNTYISSGGSITLLASGDITIGSNAYISANGQNGGTINIISTGGNVYNNGVIDAVGNAGVGGQIAIVGQIQTQLIGSLIAADGLNQGGIINIGLINTNGSGSTLAPPATAPPAFTTQVNSMISSSSISNNSTVSSNTSLDGQTGISSSNGNIVVFGDQIQVNNSNITAANGTIAIGRPSYGQGDLATYVQVTNSSLSAFKVETSGQALGISGNTVLAGEWLLDPTNVTISSAASSPTDYSTALTTAGAATINVTDIANALATGNVSISGSGSITVSNAISAASATYGLTLTGASISLGADITTAGYQTYSGPVSITTSARTLTTNGGAVSFSSTVDGGQSLTISNGSGAVSFGGTVGATTPLTSLNILGSGATSLGGSVTTSGAQYYGGNVALTTATVNLITTNSPVTIVGNISTAITANYIFEFFSGSSGSCTATATVGCYAYSTNGGTSYTTLATSSTAPTGVSVSFSAGTFGLTPTTTGSLNQYLVVGGGGGGDAGNNGGQWGSGGGGGAVISGSGSGANNTSYTITVGAGGNTGDAWLSICNPCGASGNSASQLYAGNGGNSSLVGGTINIVANGGSGAAPAGVASNVTLAGASGNGNLGGTTGPSSTCGSNPCGNGGGGAGGAGSGSAGGVGVVSSITGTSVTYGTGGTASTNPSSVNGSIGTGAGGWGSGDSGAVSIAGASGIVVLKYGANTTTPVAFAINTGSGQVSLGSSSSNTISNLSSLSITSTNTANTVSSSIGNASSGNTAVTYAGTANGKLTMSGTNTYAGGTTISGGTLLAGSSSALGTGTAIVGSSASSTGTLDLNGNSLSNDLTLNGGGAAGALINSSVTPAVESGAVTVHTSSTIGGSGNLTISGPVSAASTGIAFVGSGSKTLANSANTISTIASASTVGAIDVVSSTNLSVASVAVGSAYTNLNSAGGITLISTGNITSTGQTITNSGASGTGIDIQATGNAVLDAVTNSGANGVQITGGYGISAGTTTGGTITALGVVTNTGGTVQLSMAQPSANAGTSGTVEYSAGLTPTTAAVGTNVYYNQAGGSMATSSAAVSIDYRKALAPVTSLTATLSGNYSQSYGTAYNSTTANNWLASNTTLSVNGGGAVFGISATSVGLGFTSSIGGSSNNVQAATSLTGSSSLTASSSIFSGAVTVASANSPTYTITASPPGLSLASSSASVGYGNTAPILTPSTPSGGAITYTSSNPSAVQVNSATGAITIVGTGTATITASQASTSNYVAATNTTSITVNPALPNLAISPIASTVTFGAPVPVLVTTTTPSDAGAITYTSSNPAAVAVDPVTGVVTLVGPGAAIITATQVANGNYSAATVTSSITVNPAPGAASNGVNAIINSLNGPNNPAVIDQMVSTPPQLVNNPSAPTQSVPSSLVAVSDAVAASVINSSGNLVNPAYTASPQFANSNIPAANPLPSAADMPIASDVNSQGVVVNTLVVSPSNGLAAVIVDVPATSPSNFSFAVPNAASNMLAADSSSPATAQLPSGQPLPDWLTFDPSTMTFTATGTPPENNNLASVQIIANGKTVTLDINLANTAASPVNSVASMPISSETNTQGVSINTMTIAPDGNGAALQVLVPQSISNSASFSVPNSVIQALVPGATSSADPAVAQLPNGQPFPNWLSFDPATLSFTTNGAPPNGEPVTVQVVVGGKTINMDIGVTNQSTQTSGATTSQQISRVQQFGTYTTPEGIKVATAQIDNVAGFANVTVDVPVASQGGFGFKLPSEVVQFIGNADRGSIDVRLENGNELPSWINFDGQSLSFTANNAPEGGLPVKIQVRVGQKKIVVEISAS